MSGQKKALRLWITLLICNLIFIWGNSLLPGWISGALSDWLRSVLKWLFPWSFKGQGGGGLLRKLFHFGEFACLGICLTRVVYLLRASKVWQLLLPLLSGVAAAFLDECIQILVPGRGPALKDVGIDTMGLTVGIVLIYCIQSIKNYLEENKL